MNETKELEKLEGEIHRKKAEMARLEDQQKTMAKEAALLNRRQRTRRLCTRGGMLESFLGEPESLTDEQVMSLLSPATDSRLYNPSQKQVLEREALPMDAVKAIISSLYQLERMDRLYLALVLFTGMRRGEVLGLQWEDIDLTENLIHVQRNATYTTNQPFVGTPKTKSGFREIPIIPDLLSFLLPMGEKGFVVSQKDPEKPLTLTAFRCMMKRINTSVDLHGATSHVFRHTIGTMLNDTGADVKTIQSILGQADFKTTMDRYVHARDDKKQEAIKNVSLLLQE